VPSIIALPLAHAEKQVQLLTMQTPAWQHLSSMVMQGQFDGALLLALPRQCGLQIFRHHGLAAKALCRPGRVSRVHVSACCKMREALLGSSGAVAHLQTGHLQTGRNMQRQVLPWNTARLQKTLVAGSSGLF
jgi:hypothetical protein